MVEEVLKNMNESVITIAELKRKLPKQVNHNTLMIILDYLEKSNKIAMTLKGITWIQNINMNIKKTIDEIVEPLRKVAKQAGLTRKDVERAIREVRNLKK